MSHSPIYSLTLLYIDLLHLHSTSSSISCIAKVWLFFKSCFRPQSRTAYELSTRTAPPQPFMIVSQLCNKLFVIRSIRCDPLAQSQLLFKSIRICTMFQLTRCCFEKARVLIFLTLYLLTLWLSSNRSMQFLSTVLSLIQ